MMLWLIHLPFYVLMPILVALLLGVAIAVASLLDAGEYNP